MGSSAVPNSPVFWGRFYALLGREAAGIVLVLALALLVVWGRREWALAHPKPTAGTAGSVGSVGTAGSAGSAGTAGSEPRTRRWLRLAFGCLWLLDAGLQLQSSMPAKFSSGVAAPMLAGQPGWVQDLLRVGINVWARHPVTSAAAAVWLQLGIGLWILTTRRGRWAKAGLLAAIGWSGVVWVFGEGFGGIFAPAASWLSGAPGSVTLYAVAAGLLLLPEQLWCDRRFGERILRGLGLFFVAAGIAQATPELGMWTSTRLAGLFSAAARNPQPAILAAPIRAVAEAARIAPVPINFAVVAGCVAVGIGLRTGRRTDLWVKLAIGWCLFAWWFGQDFGVLGGVGTDPNTAIPLIAILLVGWGTARTGEPMTLRWLDRVRATLARAWEGVLPDGLAGPVGTFTTALAAVLVLGLGAAPFAYAATSPTASDLSAVAINGPPQTVSWTAPGFTLTDQDNRPVSLASLRGHVVVLAFLDPVCSNDCPVIARELRAADLALGRLTREVTFVAVAANPIYHSVADLRTFDAAEGMDALPNWVYLTGPTPQLARVWNAYSAIVSLSPNGAMVGHSDLLYVIGPHGRTRVQTPFYPGPGTLATQGSFAALVVNEVTRTLDASGLSAGSPTGR